MLLLFAPLGEPKPLAPVDYRSLGRMLEAVGASGENPAGELTAEELLRLGQTRQEAENILRRLDRQEALQTFLKYLERRGIQVLTRISPGYPRQLRQQLGANAPMLLFCAGEIGFFDTECVSLVGSRDLREPGRRFASALGREAARQGYTLVSGGAAGADSRGADSALKAGGRVLLFLPDSLEKRSERQRAALDAGKLLLVSLDGPDAAFSAARAHARNNLIHAMGQMTFVAQADYGTGGTWSGSMENLRQGWSPLMVFAEEPEDPGTRGLLERGGIPVSLEELSCLAELAPEQTGFY